MRNLLVALFGAFLLFSCSSSESSYDESVNEFNFLISTDAPSLANYSMPGMVLKNNDLYQESVGENLGAKIKVIREFRDLFFIVLPDLKKIDVIEKWTFKKVHSIDFTTLNLVPNDIDFANASEAYIIHSDDDKVSLVDLTNYAIVSQISVGDYPIAIKAIGNQIYVANQKASTVSIIDSRTKKEEAVIPVATAPTYVEAKSDGQEAIVMSLGDGRIDNAIPNAPTVTFINVASRNVVKSVNVYSPTSVKANELSIKGFTAGSNSYIFLATDKGLFRMDSKKKDKFTSASKNAYKQLYYNVRLNRLFGVNANSEILNLDLVSGVANQTIKSPLSIDFLYAY